MPGALPAVTVPVGGVAAVLAVGQRERRLELRERLGGRVAARVLVRRSTTVSRPFASRDGDRRQLGVEPAGVDRRDRLLVAGQRERVLVLAADVVLDRDALGVGAHVAVLDRAPQAVGDGRVDELGVAEPEPERAPGRRYGAPFIDSMPPAMTTSASPARISAAASMIALSPEPQTRLMVVALVVSGRPALSAAWRAGAWPRAGLQDLAHEHVVDLDGRRIEAGALDGGPDRDAAERASPGRRSAPRRTCRSACAPR